MSLVTVVVFITPHRATSERFAELVHTLYTDMGPDYQVYPVDDNGPKHAGAYVYYHGLSGAVGTLTDALLAEPWPDDTVLYIQREFMYGSEIKVGTALVRDADIAL
jgi:hypothetical protein